MKKIFTLPNILTMVRLLGAVVLLFVSPLTWTFYIVYTLSGLSDALDGFAARILHAESEFGAKLDSISDLVFYSVMVIKIFPVLLEVIPIRLWCGVLAVLIVRVLAYAVAAIKYHKFASLHTYPNKLTSIMMFFVPYIIKRDFAVIYCTAVCVCAGVAALYELLIHLFKPEYKDEKKTIVKK